uniref:Uncharacterized protein n=1 Tax=Anguilla anguilla TaxID=7936 RepID=A0A0E9T5B9_ANGAN
MGQHVTSDRKRVLFFYFYIKE